MEANLMLADNERFEFVEGLLLKAPIPLLLLLLLELPKLKLDVSVNNDIVELILGDLLNVLFSVLVSNESFRLLLPGRSLVLFPGFELLLFNEFLCLIAARAHNSNTSARLLADEVFDKGSSGNLALVSM